MKHRIAATALAVAFGLAGADAIAAAQRTFVSAAGSDANVAFNCSLVAPCRSFTSAMTVTNVNGEIIVLDSGGYGRVTIDKSVTIAAPSGVYAGISVFASTNGIDILTPGVTVALRGLTINGQGGNRGIYVDAANVRLAVEGCGIANMTGEGIVAFSVGGGEVSIKDSVVRGNDSGIIMVAGRATFRRLQIERNTSIGIALTAVTGSVSDSTIAGNGDGVAVYGSSGDAVVAISDSSIVGNGINGVSASSGGSSSALVAVTRTTLAANGQAGAYVGAGGTGVVRMEVADSTVKSNGVWGLSIIRSSGAGASVLTVTGNLISGNGGPGVRANGNDIYAIATRNTITMNAGVGLSQSTGAVVETAQDNVLRGNNAGLAQTSGTITPFGWQ